MIVHVVMMKFKPEFTEAAEETKKRLDALPAVIDVIEKYEVGINVIHSDRAYDLALYSQFKTLDDLQTYQAHPAHLKALDYIRSVVENVIAVDYEI